jgi:transcriptional regulator with XRE-family HTH domain
MTKREFAYYRKELGKTQRELAELLGTSLKAIHSYEQGWRNVPVSAERQILFLHYLNLETTQKLNQCWKIKSCPPELKRECPAWEFRSGKLCWFINGTVCEGTVQKDWRKKMRKCRKCEVFAPLLPPKKGRRK